MKKIDMKTLQYKYYYKKNSQNKEKLPSYIALGFFDGVHLGHQALLKYCVALAKTEQALSTALLLDPHPQTIVNHSNNLAFLTTLPERVSRIKYLGVQQIIVINFTYEFQKISAEDFIKKILLDQFHMGAVFVGYNYHFGYQKKGDINIIKRASQRYNFKCYVLEPVKINGEQIISSTAIKEQLKKGDIVKANQLLGYFYQINGKVIHGDKRGKKILSFPTANIKVPAEKMLPQNGVYIALITIKKQTYKGLVNIGVKPTFEHKIGRGISSDTSVEVNIFDFEGDIYNRNISISLLKKIRDEKRFTDVENLSEQIKKDKKIAESFFKENNFNNNYW
ncbi:MAG: bifunctional riboflavin kinase/FAD synthetase [Atribacterota bacterium]|nr:bifunctional riboflavin kinase/FAD synthetase [Atribacterota bacterium]MDD5496909.1 bifunctional riboflavin kinase/FAD synthetase [Atribacterota bacterium]